MPPPIDHAPHAMPRRLTLLVAGVLLIGGVLAMTSLGNDTPLTLTLAILAERLILGGGLAAWYLLAAVGLGRLARPWLRGVAHPLSIQTALGLGGLLWLSHLFGCLGLFAGHAGQVFALALLGVGAGAALQQFIAFARHGFEPRLHPFLLFAVPAFATLLVAASNPPGWLWSSEFGGYDALSYHLALPQEWLAMGRLRPVSHNVYSFLPSYLEAAFLHLAAASQAPLPDSRHAWGLVAGEGHRVFACQYLHAGITLLAAWWTGLAARAAATRSGLAERAGAFAGVVAGSILLITPWSIVTGSLAYNDMGVLALLAAALCVVFDPSFAASRRGVILGVLVGAACSIKPTALFMVAAPIALAVLLTQPPRSWLRLALGGVPVFLLVLAPWLVRNTLACGNPVFPFAAAIFANPDGSMAHWSAEQVSRYAAAHRFDGGLLDRLRLALVPEPPAEGVPDIARYRGLTHPNFGVLLPVVAAASIIGALRRSTHRAAMLMVALLLVQFVAWLFLTHLQSRFLLPMLPIAATLIALALAAVPWRTARAILAGLATATQGAFLIAAFAGQRPVPGESKGRPNALLVQGVHARTGTAAIESLASATTAERDAWLATAPPEAFVNAVFPGRRVYLLGGATPLYFAGPVVVNTTWDAWPMGDFIAAHPDTPAAWSAALRERSIDLVLIDTGEIDRLARSGWIDPRVKADDIRQWMRNHTTLVQAWPRAGIYLVAPTSAGVPSP
ncbi:MAG: hypothetical protein HBSAPP03_19340 [Phycisphaerae bacterium]|nr:MAG: hypothetical protein HBSAPP03_19340 [Phycisphaerae bacterium]